MRALVRAAGLDPDQPIEWDHDPPIQQRLWDPLTNDVSPAANDDRFIFPRQKAAHREKTAKRDIPEIAKTKRLAKKQEAFREKVLKKIEQETAALERKRSWGSRPFQRRAK
jgi:hypothetical protein